MNFFKIKKLLEDTYLLNRTHNSDDLEKAIKKIISWGKKNKFRGNFKIKKYKAFKEFNYWKIPGRWKINKFLIKDNAGKTIADINSHPLVLTPFSNSFKGKLSRNEFLSKIITDKKKPNAIPFHFRKMFRHWEKGWNIALPYNQVKKLNKKSYFIDINTKFENKPLLVLEYYLKGKKKDTIHMASHLDHPGQCNDSLSGVVSSLSTIYNLEKKYKKTNFSYSLIFCPEIIGSAAYVNYEKKVSNIKFAICSNLVGHDAPIAIAKSKVGNSKIDKAIEISAIEKNYNYKIGSWHEYSDCGDEISYDAPGVEIPTTSISRIGELYSDYHTSLDTPKKIKRKNFEEIVNILFRTLEIMELNFVPRRTFIGNPSLSNPKLNLYLEPINVSNKLNKNANISLKDTKNGKNLDPRNFQEFFLSNIEGNSDLIDLSFRSNVPFDYLYNYANNFYNKGLIKKIKNSKLFSKLQYKNISLMREHKIFNKKIKT